MNITSPRGRTPPSAPPPLGGRRGSPLPRPMDGSRRRRKRPQAARRRRRAGNARAGSASPFPARSRPARSRANLGQAPPAARTPPWTASHRGRFRAPAAPMPKRTPHGIPTRRACRRPEPPAPARRALPARTPAAAPAPRRPRISRRAQRPSRRSSSRAASADAPPFASGGGLESTDRAGLPEGGRTMPARISRARRSLSGATPDVTGSRRATGRPRSTISTDDPLAKPSISLLRLFLASVMLAFFIWLKWPFQRGYSSVNAHTLLDDSTAVIVAV